MKIESITDEYRNDFSAILFCEHCGAKKKLTSGYHDNFYHTQVIPAMICWSCGLDRSGAVQIELENAEMGSELKPIGHSSWEKI